MTVKAVRVENGNTEYWVDWEESSSQELFIAHTHTHTYTRTHADTHVTTALSFTTNAESC